MLLNHCLVRIDIILPRHFLHLVHLSVCIRPWRLYLHATSWSILLFASIQKFIFSVLPSFTYFFTNFSLVLFIKVIIDKKKKRVKILITTEKTTGFKSLRLNCWKITQVIKTCKMSTSFSRISSCYLIRSYLFKR